MVFEKKCLFFVLVLLCSGKLFAQQNKESVKVIVKENSRINSLAVNAEENLFLEVTDESVVLWNAKTLQKLHVFDEFPSPVTKIKFNSNSELFLTIEKDNTVSVFSLIDFKKIISLDSFINNANIDASFSADGRSIFTAIDGRNVDSYFILRYSKDFILQNKYSHNDTVYSVDVNKNNILLTTGLDNWIKLFDLKNNSLLCSVAASSKDCFPSAFSADGNSFICAAAENILTLRGLDGNIILKIRDDDLFTGIYSFSSDGKYFAVLCKNGAVKIYDLKTGFVDSIIQIPVYENETEDEICDVQFFEGSKSIFVCTGKGYLYKYNLKKTTDESDVKDIKKDKPVNKPAVKKEIEPKVELPKPELPKAEPVKPELPKTESLKSVPEKESVSKPESAHAAGQKEILPKIENQNAAPQNTLTQNTPAQKEVPKQPAVSKEEPKKSEAPKSSVPKKKVNKRGNSFSEDINGRIPSSTFFIGVDYTLLPSKLFFGEFNLDICFQKYISVLHTSIGFDLNGGFSLPSETFPYKYMLIGGSYVEAPWLYTIKPLLSVGVEAVSKSSNRIFFDVLAGPAIRFIWNNSMKGCIITKPVLSYTIGISAGIDFHGLTFKASLLYNTQVEFQPSAQIGYTVKYFKNGD